MIIMGLCMLSVGLAALSVIWTIIVAYYWVSKRIISDSGGLGLLISLLIGLVLVLFGFLMGPVLGVLVVGLYQIIYSVSVFVVIKLALALIAIGVIAGLTTVRQHYLPRL